jgi:hypothetical protein
MNPIIVSEFYQSIRSLKVVLLILLIIAALKYFMGDLGMILVVGLGLPNFLNALGLGTLSEEFTKNLFRFIYTMPVSRTKIWLVKFCSALVGAVLFVAVMSLIVLYLPCAGYAPKFAPLRILHLWSYVPLALSICFYAFVVGLFSVSFCLVPKNATVIGGILTNLPLLALWLIYLYFGAIARITDITFVYLAASASLLIGSLIIFLIRNPFLVRKWRWRAVGLLFGIVTAAIFCLADIALSKRCSQAEVNYISGVESFSISPDNARVFVQASKTPVNSCSYLLGSNGRLIADLGRVSIPFGAEPLLWQTGGKDGVLCQRSRIDIPRLFQRTSNRDIPLVLFDSKTDRQELFKNLNSWQHSCTYRYKRWSVDGRYLLGVKHVHREKDPPPPRTIFRQHVATGKVTDIPIPEETHPDLHAADLVTYNIGHDDDKTLVVVSLVNNAKLTHKISPDMISRKLLPCGRKLVIARQVLGKESLEYRLVVRNLQASFETTLLTPPDLPTLSFHDYIRGPRVDLSFEVSPSGKWLFCSLEVGYTDEKLWLINLDSSSCRRFSCPGFSLYRINLSNDESRLFCIDWDKDKGQMLRVYGLDEDGLTLQTVHSVPGNAHHFKFLGNDHILFIWGPRNGSLWSNNQELRILDLADGSHKRFYSQQPLPRTDRATYAATFPRY